MVITTQKLEKTANTNYGLDGDSSLDLKNVWSEFFANKLNEKQRDAFFVENWKSYNFYDAFSAILILLGMVISNIEVSASRLILIFSGVHL